MTATKSARKPHTNITLASATKPWGYWRFRSPECESLKLTVTPDPLPGFPEHATIDFTTHSRKSVETAAGELNDLANAHGWQRHPNP